MRAFADFISGGPAYSPSLAQAPAEVRLTRGLSGLSRLSRLTLTASGASHGIPDWVAALPALQALDVRMECRCAGSYAVELRRWYPAGTSVCFVVSVGTGMEGLRGLHTCMEFSYAVHHDTS